MERKRPNYPYVLYGIALFFQCPLCLFNILAMITFFLVGDTDNAYAITPFAVMLSLFVAVDIVGIFRHRRGKAHVLVCSMFMKVTIFLICFGIFYAMPGIDTYKATICFVLLGVFFGVFTAFFTKTYGNPSYSPVKIPVHQPAVPVTTHVFEGYRSQKHWDDVKEELPEGDYDDAKLIEYASMPIIYLLQWLLVREYMSSSFYKNHSKDDVYEQLKYNTPLELFRDMMDYCLAREDIDAGILKFLDVYDSPNYFYNSENNNYIHDYLNAVSNPDNLFYCVEYSQDVYDALEKVFDARLEHYRDSLGKAAGKE